MKLQATIGGQSYAVTQPGHDLSIPMHFDGPQPNTYGVPIATAKAYEQDGWVGDTQRGGSCNFETYTFTPHCNGTHTECIGHIANERIRIREILAAELVPATLCSVQPVAAAGIADSYTPALAPTDLVIDRESLVQAIGSTDPSFHQALILRTLPNSGGKKSRDYMAEPPAFFTLEAMDYLAGQNVRHLLVDLPSVDRLFDEGKLSTHHVYWGMAQGGHDLPAGDVSPRTITEMIYVSDDVADGQYLLDLQIAPFMADAAPSRPVVFPLTRVLR